MADEKPEKIDPAYPTDGGALGVGRDAALGTIGAAASLFLPMSGALVQAVLGKLVQNPLHLRQTAHLTAVSEGLRELQDRLEGFDPRRLSDNEEFVTAVIVTTRVAVATHHAEKLEALRNVVLNTAVGMTVDEVTRGAFMAYLEQFSTLHLRLMQILRDPVSAPEIQAVGGSQLMEPLVPVLVRALAEVAGPTILDIAIKDLMGARLLNNPVDLNITPDPMSSRCVSPLGLEFLRFIASPLK